MPLPSPVLERLSRRSQEILRSTEQFLAEIEALLLEPGIAGVVVTCPIDSPRLTLGTHVVQALAGAETPQQFLE